jgi:hypothetical protein
MMPKWMKLDLQYFSQDDDPPADPPSADDDPGDDPPADDSNDQQQDDDKLLTQSERSELIHLRKQAAVSAAVTDPDDQKNMFTHLEGLESAEEIKKKVDSVLFELKLGKFQQGGDPSPGNHMRQDPRPLSYERLGKELYHRIKRKQ